MSQDVKRAMMAVTDGVIGAAVLLAAGVYGGNWLDNQFHSAPWCSVGLAMLGGALGLGRMVYKATKIGASVTDPPLPKRSSSNTSEELSAPDCVSGLRQKKPFEDLEDEQN
ncbi:MAG: AtpZ/AtpI family protein [Candidatus Obscuribacterales bacterium]|nr:AtpZ/AtpI family protein [Candidatus Obscuribacterales bacterium]